MTVSGALAGLAGAGEITGTSGFLSPGVFVSIGFDSIAIALLARANPFAIIPAAILWGSMLAGAPLMQQEIGHLDRRRPHRAGARAAVRRRRRDRAHDLPDQDAGGRRARRAAAEHRLGSDRMTASAVPTPCSGVPRFGRLQTIGMLFGLLGVVLVGLRRAQPRTRRTRLHVRSRRPNPAELSFDPRTARASRSGIFFVLTAVVCLPRAALRALRTACVLVSTLLFAPLVVILSLALVGSRRHERHPAARRVVAARHADRARRDGRACGASDPGVVNIGIEGMMLAAAGVGFTTYVVLGDAQGTGWLWICDRRSRCSPAGSSPRCTRWSRSRSGSTRSSRAS